jgi:hypothetical protein
MGPGSVVYWWTIVYGPRTLDVAFGYLQHIRAPQ